MGVCAQDCWCSREFPFQSLPDHGYVYPFICPSYSLLPFSFHYYSSAFTTTLQLSLLPFSFRYYPSAFTTTLQLSLLPFSLHYYPSAFTTTLQLSLYYPLAFTILPFSFHYTSLQPSLLPFSLTLHQSLLPLIMTTTLPHLKLAFIYCCTAAFNTTLPSSLLPFIIHYYPVLI